jgi:hypothetical protein
MRSASPSSNPFESRAVTCNVASPEIVWSIWRADPVMLLLATCTANTSATPAAMPAPASSSCIQWTRSRRP